ncbi:MAG TPA: hypothetical protein VFZ28_06700, partial [Burkholderiaceae bacterium]|nr:hypothetical protein [Burkholderiaceae bacterium]
MTTTLHTSRPRIRSVKWLLATALALAAGVAGAQGKGETVRLSDQLGVITLPIRVAIAKGYCTSHGIKCEVHPIPYAALGIQSLLAKNIDGVVAALEVWTPA